MTNIYDHHSAAFRNVEAFVIVKDGERVATIAFKYGASVTAYVHWIGLEMVKGRAGGGGYDRQSAACASAMRSVHWLANVDHLAFKEALASDGCKSWKSALRDAGFDVWLAV